MANQAAVALCFSGDYDGSAVEACSGHATLWSQSVNWGSSAPLARTIEAVLEIYRYHTGIWRFHATSTICARYLPDTEPDIWIADLVVSACQISTRHFFWHIWGPAC